MEGVPARRRWKEFLPAGGGRSKFLRRFFHFSTFRKPRQTRWNENQAVPTEKNDTICLQKLTKVSSEDEGSGCHAFAGRYFRGVANGPSPEWLRKRLLADLADLRRLSTEQLLEERYNRLTQTNGYFNSVFDSLHSLKAAGYKADTMPLLSI